MKFKIENIEDLTDSRQVMERKPSKAIPLFIGLIITAIIICFLWLWFGEKEEVITASGIITLEEQTQIVSNEIDGVVKDFYVSNGDNVKKGDALYTLDNSRYLSEKDKLENQKNKLETTSKNFDKLKASVNDNINYFTESEDELLFYYQYKTYEIGSLPSSNNRESLINSQKNINSKISDIDNYKRSISENKDYNNNDSIYKEYYHNYQISKIQLEDAINKLNQSFSENKDTKLIEEEIANNRISLDKLKSDALLQAENSKSELNTQLNTINDNLVQLDSNNTISKEQNKTTILAKIEEEKNLNNNKIEELDNSIQEINTAIDKCVIKANIDGKIDVKNKLQPGTIIQTGTMIGEIINDETNLNVNLIIKDTDIGKLKVDQNIKYSITSLPYTEFGFVSGYIQNLSMSSNIDETTGLIYHTGIGSLDSTYVINKNNEKYSLSNGMTCKAKIITNKKKLLYSILEKLNIYFS